MKDSTTPVDFGTIRKTTPQELGQRLISSFPELLSAPQRTYYEQHPDALVAVFRRGIGNDYAWKQAERIARAVEFIKRECGRKLTESEVATVAEMSPKRFCLLFKVHTGETFIRYVRRLRIAHTKHLLKVTPGDIESIARNSGFNTEYFHQVFRRCTRKMAPARAA